MKYPSLTAEELETKLCQLRLDLRQYRGAVHQQDVVGILVGKRLLLEVNKLIDMPLQPEQKAWAGTMMALAIETTYKIDPAQLKVDPRKNYFAVKGETDPAINRAAAVDGVTLHRGRLIAGFAGQIAHFIDGLPLPPPARCADHRRIAQGCTVPQPGIT